MTQASVRIVSITDAAGEKIPNLEISVRQVQQSIAQLLAQNILCSMATVTAEGHAHINTTYFCSSPEITLYFLSHPKALHCQNLLDNPSMAIAIFPSNQTWGKPDRGLQLFGICKQVTGREASKADKLYNRRFPEYRAWKADLAADSTGWGYRFYRFVTAELKVFDEERLGSGAFILAEVKRRSGPG